MNQKEVRARPDNELFFRELIADWPELNDLVRSLRNQGLFPGIRCMRFIKVEPMAHHRDAPAQDPNQAGSSTPPT